MPARPLRLHLPTLILGSSLLLTACAETPAQPAAAQPKALSSALQAAPLTPASNPVEPDSNRSFSQWQADFRQRALAAGIQPSLLDASFANLSPDPAVLRADSAQPEFSRPVWEYLEGAISPLRLRRGQALLGQHAATLAAIEQRYGVDRQILVAVWGMESGFGQFMGDKSVVRSLATLAHHGRRARFAEDQLLAALQIIQHGDISIGGMLGSWAGAMGQTQFIPTTYLSHAVDFDGDGRRDIWNSSADALASAAHYLQASGWRAGQPWGSLVSLPGHFDYSLADPQVRLSLSQWQARGVQLQGPAVADGLAQLVLPAGHRGPAFLVYNNFNAILRYNNSTAYALAIGLLGDRLQGAAPLQLSWPTDERPLSRSQRIALQEGLSARGYQPGAADGIIGANSRRALREFQQSLGWPADGYPTQQLLQQLQP